MALKCRLVERILTPMNIYQAGQARGHADRLRHVDGLFGVVATRVDALRGVPSVDIRVIGTLLV
jgi:hypothetical protein